MYPFFIQTHCLVYGVPSKTLEANIVSILLQLNKNDLEGLLEEAEDDPNIKTFLQQLDLMFNRE